MTKIENVEKFQDNGHEKKVSSEVHPHLEHHISSFPNIMSDNLLSFPNTSFLSNFF